MIDRADDILRRLDRIGLDEFGGMAAADAAELIRELIASGDVCRCRLPMSRVIDRGMNEL